MKNVTAYYNRLIDVVEIETTDHSGEPHSIVFISAGSEHVGIYLDGVTKYFTVRGVKAPTIKPTKTGISIYQCASVLSFVEHGSEEDALWLATEAHRATRPYRHQVFSADVVSDEPILANGYDHAAFVERLRRLNDQDATLWQSEREAGSF